jgi:hypothetical protein
MMVLPQIFAAAKNKSVIDAGDLEALRLCSMGGETVGVVKEGVHGVALGPGRAEQGA